MPTAHRTARRARPCRRNDCHDRRDLYQLPGPAFAVELAVSFPCSLACTSDRDALHPQRRLADADRHALAVLAAGADPGIERRSLPIMVMRCRSVGPLPISIAPFSGAPILPFSIL